MSDWSHHCESLRLGRATKYTLSHRGMPLTFDRALDLLMSAEQGLTGALTELLRSSPYSAYRWETPPISTLNIGRPFEFVLTDDPFLDMTPEPEVFRDHFVRAPAGTPVLAVPNLSGTATMVIPRQIAEPGAYTHLSNFVRHAPSDQVVALWACVAATARSKVSEMPLWVSTAGGGVSWLHVRIEGTPKYYAHRPYATRA